MYLAFPARLKTLLKCKIYTDTGVNIIKYFFFVAGEKLNKGLFTHTIWI